MKLKRSMAATAVAAALLVPAAAGAQAVAYDRFDQIDTDRNGVISRAEWDAAVQRGPEAFQRQQYQNAVPGAAQGSTAPPHYGYVTRDYPPRMVYDVPAPQPVGPAEYPPTVRFGPR
jgi:hypothetical protein